MMRFLVALVGVLVFVAIAWIVYVSVDSVVPFSRLDLTAVSVHGVRAPPAEGDGSAEGEGSDGRVLVMFAWRAHEYGQHCVRVSDDVAVGVGGSLARGVRFGGGVWVMDGVVPWPRHRCINHALFEIDRPALPGIVGVTITDLRGKRALMSARDVLTLPSVTVTSPQPARVGARATIEVSPASVPIERGPSILRARGTAWPVDVEESRAAFTVPSTWIVGTEAMRVIATRRAAVLRCEGAPSCTAMAIPVDDTKPFVIEAP